MTLGRKNHLFAGSDGGADRWTVIASLIETAKLNGVEPYTYLKDILERMTDGHSMRWTLTKHAFVTRHFPGASIRLPHGFPYWSAPSSCSAVEKPVWFILIQALEMPKSDSEKRLWRGAKR